MTVRTIVQMFESLASRGAADESTRSPESPGRSCVPGLVSYFDHLGDEHERPVLLAARRRHRPATSHAHTPEHAEPQKNQTEDEPQQDGDNDTVESPETTECRVATPPPAPASRIPVPKSREQHKQNEQRKRLELSAPCSVRRVDCAKRAFPSCSRAIAATPTRRLVPPAPPATPRSRTPCTSYAAFVAKIEGSESRLLDFEKDERWIGQVEVMKGRVEALKRSTRVPLTARELTGSPRKSRSRSSSISTVSSSSTARSLSPTPERDSRVWPQV